MGVSYLVNFQILTWEFNVEVVLFLLSKSSIACSSMFHFSIQLYHCNDYIPWFIFLCIWVAALCNAIYGGCMWLSPILPHKSKSDSMFGDAHMGLNIWINYIVYQALMLWVENHPNMWELCFNVIILETQTAIIIRQAMTF